MTHMPNQESFFVMSIPGLEASKAAPILFNVRMLGMGQCET